MALWNDGITIWEKVNTGNLSGKVLFTKVYGEEDYGLPYSSDWGTIFCRIDYEDAKKDHKITIDINRVKDKTNWVLSTRIENTGTIPVRFLTPVIFADYPLDVGYDLPIKVFEFGQKGLDPGEAVEVPIIIGLKSDQPGTYPFHIELKSIQWNAYNENPRWWHDTQHIYGTVVVQAPPEEEETH